MTEFFTKFKAFLLFMVIYWCVCFIMSFKSGSFLYVMLAWNVLLAVLPLLFINKAEFANEQKKFGWSVFWMILWLAFFPNSVYMVTDFIHISSDKFMWLAEVEKYSSNSKIIYSTEIVIWVKLLVIGIGFLLSLFVGLESLHIFEQIIKKKFKLGYPLGILGVLLLSGIGVYIGRFLRFNSWDILFNPIQLLKQFALEMNWFAVKFIVAFTIFEISSYFLYRTLKRTTD